MNTILSFIYSLLSIIYNNINTILKDLLRHANISISIYLLTFIYTITPTETRWSIAYYIPLYYILLIWKFPGGTPELRRTTINIYSLFLLLFPHFLYIFTYFPTFLHTSIFTYYHFYILPFLHTTNFNFHFYILPFLHTTISISIFTYYNIFRFFLILVCKNRNLKTRGT